MFAVRRSRYLVDEEWYTAETIRFIISPGSQMITKEFETAINDAAEIELADPNTTHVFYRYDKIVEDVMRACVDERKKELAEQSPIMQM